MYFSYIIISYKELALFFHIYENLKDIFLENVLNQILVLFILFFSVSLFFLVLAIIFSKSYIQLKKSRYEERFNNYTQCVFSFMLGELSQDDVIDIMQGKSRDELLVFTDVLMQIDKAENTSVSRQLRSLYMKLNLNELSSKKFHKYSFQKQVEGLREVSHMKVRQEVNDVREMSENHSNEILRSEAIIGMMRMTSTVPFYFMDKLQDPFTVWEQINVLDTMRKSKIEIPEFQLWLDSPNDSIVMFCLDMIRIFHQDIDNKMLRHLLRHSNDYVRRKAIKTSVTVRSNSVVDLLQKNYLFESVENKLNILMAIGHLKREEKLDFLLNALNEDQFEVRMAACEAILLNGETGMNLLLDLLPKADSQLQSIIKHVLDPRI